MKAERVAGMVRVTMTQRQAETIRELTYYAFHIEELLIPESMKYTNAVSPVLYSFHRALETLEDRERLGEFIERTGGTAHAGVQVRSPKLPKRKVSKRTRRPLPR